MAFLNAEQPIFVKVDNTWQTLALQDLQASKLASPNTAVLAWDIKGKRLVQRKLLEPVELVVPPHKEATCYSLKWNNGSKLQATPSVRIMLSAWLPHFFKYDERKTTDTGTIAKADDTAFVSAAKSKGGDTMHTLCASKNMPHPQTLLARPEAPEALLLMKCQEVTITPGSVFCTLPKVGEGFAVMLASGVFLI